MSNGDAKHVSAGAAKFNMAGFVKLFWIRTSVARQVSRKVEPFSTSATVATIAEVMKTRVYTSWNWSAVWLGLVRLTTRKTIRKRSNKLVMIHCKHPKQNGGWKQNFKSSSNVSGLSTCYVTRWNACWKLFLSAVASKLHLKNSTFNNGLA